MAGTLAGALIGAARAADEPAVLQIGNATIEVTFPEDSVDVPRAAMLDWVSTGARAVAAYIGKFPVSHAKIGIQVANGRRGGRISGVTFGEGGARSVITVAPHITAEELANDWVMTHEMTHYAFPSMDRDHRWIEEGSATYIEPIARAMVGNLSVEQVWGDMVRYMAQGLPEDGDQGLDRTHTWGRTYWGGAIFCLLADVEIRKQTGAGKGLVDAFRGIARAGGNITVDDWPIERAFQAGDKATGTKALMTLYAQMAGKAVPVDLPDLWRQLGVKRENGQVTFDERASLAKVRAAICAVRP